MRKLFSSKKTMFVLGLVLGAFLILLFTFALPGKRTYTRPSVEDFEEELAEVEPEEIDHEEELLVLEPIPDLETRRIGGKVEEGISRVETAKVEPKKYPIIPHDHIPNTWEYKMRE